MSKTSFKKFISYNMVITLFVFLYVHQNIEIYKTGYIINSNQKALSYFLDQHNRLLYNLNKLKSPVMLDTRLNAQRIELVEPDTNRIYYASKKEVNSPQKTIRNNKESIIAKVADVFIERAEARTARLSH